MLVNRNMYFYPTALANMSRIFGIFGGIYNKGPEDSKGNDRYNIFSRGEVGGQEFVRGGQGEVGEFFGRVWGELKGVAGKGGEGAVGVLERLDGEVWKIWMDNMEGVNLKACRIVFMKVIEGKELKYDESWCRTWAKDMVRFFLVKNRTGRSLGSRVRSRMDRIFGIL